jgi:sec-independent protein translocase protein TatA
MKLGVGELLVILVIVIMIFGGKRIPELAKGMGEGIKNFKKSMKDDDDDKEKK